jgi:cytochrome c oxidase cbb3-type subunit 3
MQAGSRAVAAAIAGVTILLIHMAGQTPAAQSAPPQGGVRGASGRGRGANAADASRALATFPAQQRPPGDPVLVARGKSLYAVNCQACHGSDLRGGDLGGPNLLRSQVVLSDQDGELILPIIQGARQSTGMPAISLNADDVKATVTYIHNVVGTSRTQGSPPDSGAPPPNILIGDAAAGQKYFAAKCAGCHSATGDLQGLASRFPDARTLQNRWVSGGGGGRGAAMSERRIVTVTVTQPSGETAKGRLVRIDDFLVTLADADGLQRTFRRDGDAPKVEVDDPMRVHRELLAVYTDKDMHDVTAWLVTLK